MPTLAAKKVHDHQKETGNDLVFSYLTLRNLIGIFGMLLPVILALTTSRGENDEALEQSISHYYYTSNGDVFVVLMSVLGVFLLTYKGYGWVERMITLIAAICALGVAFSPTECKDGHIYTIHKLNPVVTQWFGIERHLVFAASFFLCLAIMSLVYFPKSDKESLRDAEGKLTPKAKRNIVFKICGWTIIASLIALFLHFKFAPHTTKPWLIMDNQRRNIVARWKTLCNKRYSETKTKPGKETRRKLN